MTAPHPPAESSTGGGSGKDRPPLLAAHLESLQAGSGLTLETIKKVPLSSITDAEDARRTLNWAADRRPPPVPALRIDYPAADYVRLRPDKPRVDQRGRPVKYEAPVGERSRIYIPRQVAPAIDAPGETLFVTEGEKKALAACQAGIPCVAAPGINSFHDVAKRRAGLDEGADTWQLHPDLEKVIPPARTITIVFDSDVDKKPEIVHALVRLANMVAGGGATPMVSFLPAIGGQAKSGLDDVYVHLDRNGDALRRLLADQQRPTDPDRLLDWLATRWRRWNTAEQDLQLSRAIPFIATEDERAVERWAESAAKQLSIGKRHLNHLVKLARQARHRECAWLDDDGVWMSAPGFKARGSGRYKGIWKDGEDGKDAKPIAPAPINIVENGEAEDGTIYCTLRYQYGNDERMRTVDRQTVMGPDLIKLSAFGAPITQANRGAMQVFLARQEQHNSHLIPKVDVFTRPGWSRDFNFYVHGRKVIGGTGRVIVDTDEKYLAALEARGSRDRYLDLCREVRRQSAAAEMMVSAGYVGPILRLVRRRPFSVSQWGPSRRGKSATQAVSMSPWGRPEAMKLTGDASQTAVEAALVRANDLQLWIDDTMQKQRRTAFDQFAYQVGGGTGRGRGTVTGGIRTLKDWVCVALVSGEHPTMRPGVAAGARNRMLEIRVAPVPDPAFAKQIHQELDHHHGWTGPEFIRALIERFVRPRKVYQLDELLSEFDGALGGRADEARDQVATLVLANYLSRVIVFGEDDSTARLGALHMGSEILCLCRSDGEAQVHTVEAAYDAITAWVAENDLAFQEGAPRRFGVLIPQSETGGKRVVAILREPLKELARRAEFDLEEVVAGLRDRGLLLAGEAGRLTRKTPQFGPDRPRAYWIVLGDTTAPGDQGGNDDASSGRSGLTGGREDPQAHPTAAEPRSAAPDFARPPPESSPHPSLVGDLTVVAAGRPHSPDARCEGPAIPDVGPIPPRTKNDDTTNRTDSFPCERTAGPTLNETAGPFDWPGSNQPLPTDAPHLSGGEPLGCHYDLVCDPQEIATACQRMSGQPVLGLDIETFATVAPESKNDKPALDAFRNQVRLLQLADTTGAVTVFDLLRLGGLPEPLRALLAADDKSYVGFNLAFDAKNLLHHFDIELKRPIDLFAGAVLADGYKGFKDGASQHRYTLQAVANRLLYVGLDKSLQTSDWGSSELSSEQIRYAANDVSVLARLHAVLQRKAKGAGVERAWHLENGVILPLAAMELAGIEIDRNAATSLLNTWQQALSDAKRIVQEALGPINLNSLEQVRQALRERCGLEIPDSQETTLREYAHAFPAVEAFLSYRRANKLISTYGNPWLAAAARDGRIHPSFHALGTPTGRISCSHPNLQNVPRDAAIRACFVPARGNKFIIADYSAIELRVLAQLLGEKELLRCFCGSPPVDPHTRTASFLTGKSPDHISPEDRSRAKPVNFGFAFGMGAARFVGYARDDYGIEYAPREARQVQQRFMRLYPGIAAWHRRSRSLHRRNLEARTLSGRLRRFAKPNLAEFLNTPVQGTAADGAKSALALLHTRLPAVAGKVVNMIHDEFIVEVPDEHAEEAKGLVASCMREGMTEFVTDVPIEVDAHIDDCWKK